MANRISSLSCCHCERSEAISKLDCHGHSEAEFPRNDNGRSVTKSGKFGIFLRKIFLKIDICRFKRLVKKLEKDDYDFVVSDRYFYDSVVNIEFLNTTACHSRTGGNPENKNVTGSRIKCGMTKNILIPNIALYLQVDPKIIMQRERKPDQGLAYLERKKEIYDKYVSLWNLKIINGNRNKEEIFAEIKKLT
jgi:thymidylate kinase